MRPELVQRFAEMFGKAKGLPATDSPHQPKGNAMPDDTNLALLEQVSGGRLKKELRWKIESGKTVTEVLTITPEMASLMLEWNDRNRPLAAATVKKYADAMKRGRWTFTGVPVIFAHSRLIDGQHRLQAIVDSGVAVTCLVVYGAPDDAFAFIDTGKSRGAADVFAINGVKNWNLMAGATKWLVSYHSDRQGVVVSKHYTTLPDHDELYRAYLDFETLQDSAWVGNLMAQHRIASPTIMVAIHYLAAQRNRAMADEFFRCVGEGLGFAGKKDPAYRLHQRLISAATAGEKMGRRELAAITIKAWNAARLGRDVAVLRFGADETFPKVL